MDVKKYMRELRLQEAAEHIRRNSENREGNQTQVYEPKSPVGMFGNNREIVSDVVEATEGGANGRIPTASSPHLTQRSNSQVSGNRGTGAEQQKLKENTGKSTSPGLLKLQR